MATQKKTAEVDYSMQEKILALYDLQKIDSQIDAINKIKGELPLEVQDLDDELAGLRSRVENINAEIEEFNALTKQRKREVDQAKIQIGNYKEQQNNVRNNREFDAIAKEIEYQELVIELAEKRLKEYAAGVKGKKAQVEETESVMAERQKDLEAKQAELQSIEEETASQVADLTAQAEKAQAKIDERLLAEAQKKAGYLPSAERTRTMLREKYAALPEETVKAAEAQLSALEEGARRQEKEAAHALAEQARGGVSEVTSLASEKDVRSPVSGDVTRVVMEPGEIAPAGFPIVLVTDLDDSWAVFNVREDELPNLAVGTEVTAKVPAIGRDVKMTVYWVNPRGDYATWRATRQTSGYDLRTFEVRLRPEAGVEGLRPGMSVILERNAK